MMEGEQEKGKIVEPEEQEPGSAVKPGVVAEPGTAGEPAAAPEPATMPDAQELPATEGEPPPPRPQKASTLSILALVLAVGGLIIALSGAAGVILGFVELNRIKTGRSSTKGYTFARAAIIIGIITVILYLVILFYTIQTGGLSSG